MSNRIGVVVLDFDQSPITERCLRSLAAGSRSPDAVAVVENGNTSAVVDLNSDSALAELPVTVIRPGRNIGAAGGRNLGLNYLARNTDVDVLLVLDNDTTVPPELIELLAERSLEPLEVVAPLVLDMDSGGVFSAGGVFDEDGHPQHLATWPEGSTEPRSVDWAATAALAFGRDTWLRVGGFDNRYGFVWEDAEWCHRAVKSGASIRLVPELRVFHQPHQSGQGPFGVDRVRRYSRNGTVFMVTSMHAGPRSLLRWFGSEFRSMLHELRAGWIRCALARLQGLGQGLLEVRRRRREARDGAEAG